MDTLRILSTELDSVVWMGKDLLGLNIAEKRVFVLDAKTQRSLKTFALNLRQPKALVFDGASVWVADEADRKIVKLNPTDGQLMQTIELKVPPEKGFGSIEGLAWDGSYLWVAIYAGFSSSYNRIDPHNGQVVLSIFADCHPRGIASDGQYLWSVCYSGPARGTKIDQREIIGQEHEMRKTRKFIAEMENVDPAGLSYTGKNLWMYNRLDQKIKKIIFAEQKK
jgi:hypothetical protein